MAVVDRVPPVEDLFTQGLSRRVVLVAAQLELALARLRVHGEVHVDAARVGAVEVEVVGAGVADAFPLAPAVVAADGAGEGLLLRGAGIDGRVLEVAWQCELLFLEEHYIVCVMCTYGSWLRGGS